MVGQLTKIQAFKAVCAVWRGGSLRASSSLFPRPLERCLRCEPAYQGLTLLPLSQNSPGDPNAENHCEDPYKMHFCPTSALSGNETLRSVWAAGVGEARGCSTQHSLPRLSRHAAVARGGSACSGARVVPVRLVWEISQTLQG